jgi:phage gpG-like protein
MDVFDTLSELTKALQNSERKQRKVGSMATDMIRSHLYRGQGFAPLSPATAEYRGAGRPLQDTGALRDSITYSLAGSDTVSVGTNKPYAKIQNNGGVIRAKKNWLWIPATGTRQLQRRYGYGVTAVLNGLKAAGYSVFRKGRTVCFRKKGEKNAHTAFYLKKSVEIPKREFFYLTEKEKTQLMQEVGLDLNFV